MDTLPTNGDSTNVTRVFRHYGPNIRAAVMMRGYTSESCPGDNSSLCSSPPFNLSQLYPAEHGSGRRPSGQVHTMSSGQDNDPQRIVEADGRSLILRAVGSQLLKDDRQMIRPDTLSTTTQQLAEPESERIDNREELSKQREYKAKAAKVAAELEIELAELIREGEEEREQNERDKWAWQERKENARKGRVRAKALLKLQGLAGEDSEEESETDEEDEYRPPMTSSHMKDSSYHREDMRMRELVANFQQEDLRVRNEIVQRYKSQNSNQPQNSSSTSQEPPSLTNTQLRGDENEILRRQAKRQQQLELCAEAPSNWLLMLDDIQKEGSASSSEGRAPEAWF
ncbi:hypothetical protein BDP27DRAFT_1356621 [Rhodocollybia butyracea]|uniref:Uncharacterized protein n=1 Tax=Rhodocollybia butyracea TaxID=206335 RepID=A0A9P5QB52_9AGAR|nr:hypothetical protein BDP27DRAFT_1356621 [Rhodocollybia butyracea]